MARSVFYYHLKGLRNVDKYISEKEEIKSIFHEHKGRYGYRCVTVEMRNRDFIINHKTVKREEKIYNQEYLSENQKDSIL